MESRRDSRDVSESRIKDIEQKKKLGKRMRYCGFILIGVTLIIMPVYLMLDLNLPNIVAALPMILSVPLIFGGDSVTRNALLLQKDLKIDKMPDEAERERKDNERIKELAASPNEMDREFKRLAKLNKLASRMFFLGLVLMGVCLVVAILSGVFPITFPDPFIPALACATIFLLFPGIMLYSKVDKRQKQLALQYTPGILSEIMDRLDKYDVNGSVDQKYMWEDFAFGSRDRIGKCGDYVKGVLRGMPVEFCEFEIQCEHSTTDDEGRRTTEVRTSFSGLMAVCRHGFKLANNVTMTQFSRYFKEIKTESIEFTRAWSVKEDSGHAAFLILTPQYIETLMATIREKRRRMGIQFRTDGVLLIVLQRADFFEVDEAEKVEELKEKIRTEMKDLADIMENVGALTEKEIEMAQ